MYSNVYFKQHLTNTFSKRTENIYTQYDKGCSDSDSMRPRNGWMCWYMNGLNFQVVSFK